MLDLQASENQAFLREHRGSDPHRLLLRFRGKEPEQSLCRQLAWRQKIKQKLPTWFSDLRLQIPDGIALEQCSSEATAQLKASMFKGEAFADLTGGLGIDTAALARQFRRAYFVEPDAHRAAVAEANFRSMNLSVTVFKASAEEVMAELPPLDLLYLDPDRRALAGKRSVQLAQYQPDIIKLWPRLQAKAPQIAVKVSPAVALNAVRKKLPGLAEIWIIALHQECKEVILYWNETVEHSPPLMRTWHLGGRAWQRWSAPADPPPPPVEACGVEDFIFEPNPALRKGGISDDLLRHFPIKKLHPQSWLYTGSEDLSHFPGKRFRLLEKAKPFGPGLKGQKWNVVTRNFPKSAAEIQKQLALKPSQTHYLFATRDLSGWLFLLAEIIAD